MSSQPLNGRITSKNAGSGAVFTALVAFSILAFTAGSGRAQSIAEAQADINAQLAATHRTIANATAASLAEAVATAVQSDTDPTLTPAIFAEAALSPANGGTSITATQKAAAPAVTSAVITKLIIDGTTSPLSAGALSFAADAAAITDGVVDVGGGVTTESLAIATKEAVVKSALLAISEGPATVSSAPLSVSAILAADKSIGAALTDDAALESLALSTKAPNGLMTILEVGIGGVVGSKTTAATIIPQAAADFVAGIVDTGTIPDSTTASPITLATFASGIMAPLAKNANADELIANAIGTEYNTTPQLDQVAAKLFTSYPTEVAKITQGLTAAVAASTNETGRDTFINGLVASSVIKDAPTILEGAVFTDPYYSGLFADTVMTDIYGSTTTVHGVVKDTGPAALIADAPVIAAGIGSILGQDGNELTSVSGTFASFIEDGHLPAAAAATYAVDLISNAAHSKLPAADFSQITPLSDGDDFALGSVENKVLQVPAQSVADMESIGDQFAVAIATADDSTIGTLKGAETAAAQIGVLAEDIAKITGAGVDVGNGGTVAANLAASVADTVLGLGLTTMFPDGKLGDKDAQELILAAIQADVDHVTPSKPDEAAILAAIQAVETSSTNGQVYAGSNTNATITLIETPITNL